MRNFEKTSHEQVRGECQSVEWVHTRVGVRVNRLGRLCLGWYDRVKLLFVASDVTVHDRQRARAV